MAKWVLMGAAYLLLMGCTGAPTKIYTTGDLLLDEDFEAASGWQEFDLPDGALALVDGRYQGATPGGVFVWGLKVQEVRETVIEVEAELRTGNGGDNYGVICRGKQNGDGYYFLIGNDGTFSIRRGRGQEVAALIPWARAVGINTGAGARNTIRAVCVDEYQALYINGQFAGEARDDLYSRGYPGVAFVSKQGEPMRVEYDNFKVWAAAVD